MTFRELSILLLFPVYISAFPDPSQSYDGSAILRDEAFRLFWTVRDDVITFEAQVLTLGWIGLGLSTNGNMPGADIFTAWVTSQGTLLMQDRYAIAQETPPIDKKQDWQPLWGMETGGYTLIKFRRKLKPCDEQDMDIHFGTIRLIYAWHSKDPESEQSLLKHEERGSMSVVLLPDAQPQTLPPDKQELRFFVNNYQVPEQKTTYYCAYFALPKLEKKYHIVKAEVLVQPGNENLVHHLVLMWCDPDIDPDLVNAKGHDCDTWRQYPEFVNISQRCKMHMWAWAKGGMPYVYPLDVGIPIGTEKSSKVLLFELHYSNDNEEKGRFDSSGVVFTITPTLRQFDSNAVFSPRDFPVFPPRQKDFVIYGICNLDTCLQWVTGVETIKIFAAFLHTHYAGTRIRARHFRNGKELPLILEEPYYDPSFQQTYVLHGDPVVVVLKTDQLVVECHYDTSDRSFVTYNDGSSIGEMCVAFYYFYPGYSFMRCGNIIDKNHLLPIVGIESFLANGTVTAPSKMAGKQWQTVFGELDWTNKNISDNYQKGVSNNIALTFCEPKDFSTQHVRDVPFNLSVYQPEKQTCIYQPLTPIKERPPKYGASADCITTNDATDGSAITLGALTSLIIFLAI